MEKELQECIDGCRHGDPKAQSELYVRYASWMKQRVLPLVGDEALAEDLVHDTFILILEHIGELRDASRLEPWMSLTLRRVALQYLRSWYARHISFPGELPEKRLGGADPAVSVSLGELYRLSDRLPEGYRKVFRMAYFKGMSHGEIAQILGIRPHTSSSQLARARALFRKLLKEYGIGTSALLFWIWLAQNPEWHVPSEDLSPLFQSPEYKPVPEYSPASSRSRFGTYGTSASALPTGKGSFVSPDTVYRQSQTEDRAEKDSLHEQQHDEKESEKFRLHFPSGRLPMAESWKRKVQRRNRWSVSLAYSQNRGLETVAPKAVPILKRSIGSGCTVLVPEMTTSWDEYYEYLTTYFPSFENPEKVLNLIDIANQNKGQQIKETAYYDQPFVFKLSVSRQWHDRWQMDLGIQYKKLGARFKIGTDSLLLTRQTVHYLGISSGVGWKWWQGRGFNLQATVGMTLDIPVSWSSRTDYVFEGRPFYSEINEIHPPRQWSVFGGIGIEVPLTRHFSLYLGPQMNYYLPAGGSVKTIHADRSFEFSVPVGIRWTY